MLNFFTGVTVGAEEEPGVESEMAEKEGSGDAGRK